MQNSNCRPAPRWRRFQYKWYSRLLYAEDTACVTSTVGPLHARDVRIPLLYTEDDTCITSTAGPLHAGDVPNTTGIVASSILEMLHVLQ